MTAPGKIIDSVIAAMLLLCSFAASSEKVLGQIVSSASAGNAGGYLYADQCSGNDVGARILNCQDRLPINSGGYRAGTIVLPNTVSEPALAAWSTSVVLTPGVNLIGQGLFASSFRCTVAGDCLVHDASGTGPGAVNHHTVIPNTVYQGFTITGNSAPNQNIVHFLDAQSVMVRDVAADGANETGGACIELTDVKWWTERNTFSNVSTLYGCNIGWRFTVADGNPNEPHPSFGYNRFLDIKANTSGMNASAPAQPQLAFSFEKDAYIYSSTFRVTVNKGGVGSRIIHMQDNAEFYDNEVHFFGEENGNGGYFLDLTSAKNEFTYMGEINFTAIPNHVVPGAIVTHWGDDGGYGPAVPTNFYNGIQWGKAISIPPGADLNSYVACGDFSGSRLVNAPTLIGSHNLRVEVVCSDNPGYLTQIAYMMEYTAVPRAWQRIRANGAWGPWREMSWGDQLPLAGTTGALPASPIAAGSCATLTATVSGATNSMTVTATPASYKAIAAGLHWDTAYVSAADTVTVPVCNSTSAPITPAATTFNVRAIQ